MTDDTYRTEIHALLTEIRDTQRESLAKQEEHLTLAHEQLERSRAQVDESIGLQRQAMARFKTLSFIALPAILLCIALIVWLIARFL